MARESSQDVTEGDCCCFCCCCCCCCESQLAAIATEVADFVSDEHLLWLCGVDRVEDKDDDDLADAVVGEEAGEQPVPAPLVTALDVGSLMYRCDWSMPRPAAVSFDLRSASRCRCSVPLEERLRRRKGPSLPKVRDMPFPVDTDCWCCV